MNTSPHPLRPSPRSGVRATRLTPPGPRTQSGQHVYRELVVIGASLGGLQVLQTVLGGLAPDFPAAVVIVQHRASDSSDLLASVLQRNCTLPVTAPDDKEPILHGHVYIAPPNYHLLVDDGGFALTNEAPVHHARPSIDVLFESAAECYGERVIGILLSASSTDGVAGAAAIKARGGAILVQDPETAESRVLPDAVVRAVAVDRCLPPRKIAPFLSLSCRPGAVPLSREAGPASRQSA